MGRHLIGILICIALVLNLNGFKSEILQGLQTEVSARGENTNYQNGNGFDFSNQENEETVTNNLFSFDTFSNGICDVIPVSVSVSVPRGISFPKHLKFTSTIQVLSSLHTPLFVRDSQDLYFHHCFVKSSCRYFVYTLRRLLI